jgi:hypothetical protein
MEDLRTEFLCDVVVYVDWKEIIDIGVTPHGNRQIIYLKGGTFEGPKIRGVILPGGGDWFIRRSDGVVETDVRAIVRTYDNHMIYTYFRGITDMALEVALKLISGEVVDSSKYYYRVTPVIETASEKYGWLNRIVTVGIGSLTPAGTTYKVYTVM